MAILSVGVFFGEKPTGMRTQNITVSDEFIDLDSIPHDLIAGSEEIKPLIAGRQQEARFTILAISPEK